MRVILGIFGVGAVIIAGAWAVGTETEHPCPVPGQQFLSQTDYDGTFVNLRGIEMSEDHRVAQTLSAEFHLPRNCHLP